MLGAYLEIFDAEDTISETLEAARERYRGQFDSWADWAEEEYESGVITVEALVEYGCIDWNSVANTFNDGCEMADNGMVFSSTF